MEAFINNWSDENRFVDIYCEFFCSKMFRIKFVQQMYSKSSILKIINTTSSYSRLKFIPTTLKTY